MSEKQAIIEIKVPYVPHGKLTGLVETYLESFYANLPAGFLAWNLKQQLEYFTEWLNKNGYYILVVPTEQNRKVNVFGE